MLSLCRNIKNSVGIGIRYVLLKSLAKDIGDNVSIRENVIILSPKSLSIGKNVSVHPNCYIDAAGGITIGDNVSIATSSILISTSHTWDNEEIPIKYNPMKSTPIKIDNDVWIGCNVKIIGPCHIGERSICAAGAVVKGEIVRHCIVGGVPAKTIKTI
ncbi:MAG: acyltransferase [Bacteroidales bacterium]|nr:acyltransferase [Bacteroidales bacterium]